MNDEASISGSAPGLRVLLVENHDDSRLVIGMMLKALGHEVASVASMGEALAALAESTPDVLLSDIGLPDGDGWELMRQAPFARPVYAIAMSGYGMAADRERSRAAGFRHHLVKPMDIEKLETLLGEAARERASRA